MTSQAESAPVDLGTVLADMPPGREYEVVDLLRSTIVERVGVFERPTGGDVPLPEIEAYCETCTGARRFEEQDHFTVRLLVGKPVSKIVRYQCRNCNSYEIEFAVRISLLDAERRVGGRGAGRARVAKLGQWPPFGPRTPARLLSLLGDDRSLFLQGRRAEVQGLGIGAYAYYRRIVEGSRTRLLDAIIRVGERTGLPRPALEQLREAAAETQFKKSLEMASAALPKALMFGEVNPLTLLHQATSKGIHELDDGACLSRAQAIRTVLVELAERIAGILQDQRTLEESIKALGKLLEEPSPEGEQRQG